MNKNIIVRTDSSDIIGTGHLYRCLNLANYYPHYNFYFISKLFPNNAVRVIKEHGYQLYPISIDNNVKLDISCDSWLGEEWQKDLEKTVEQIEKIKTEVKEDIDYLIIDHYAIGYQWEKAAAKYVKKIFVIDDLLERKHFCHFYLNQQYEPTEENINIIRNITSKNTIIYLGNNYLTIDKLFFEAASKKKINNQVKRVNIYFGGADHLELTYKLCQLLSGDKYCNIQFDVIVGYCNKKSDDIKQLISTLSNFTYYSPLSYPALISLYLKTDLVIGALGTSCYERAVLGLPTIAIQIADNQKSIKDKFIKNKLIIQIDLDNLLTTNIKNSLDKLLIDNNYYNNLVIVNQNYIDINKSLINTVL